jgi:hypothetical protein
MGAALEVLLARRRPDGRWTARAWPGQTHVPADPSDRSRWTTLIALRVIERYAS